MSLTNAQLLGGTGEGVILYRADLHILTGDVNAALLLSQILYWWVKMGRHPFYKYAAPCDSARPGDSWQEEMHFSRCQFESARHKIAARCYTGSCKAALLKTSLVVYWVDRQGRTWYEVNEGLLAQRLQPLGAVAENTQPLPDATILQHIGNAASPQPIEDVENPQPIVSEITPKTTTETNKALVGSPSSIFTPICELFADNPVKYSLAEVWMAAMWQLELQMDRGVFRWIRDTRLLDLENDTLIVRAPNQFACKMLEGRVQPALERSITDIAEHKLTLRVVTASEQMRVGVGEGVTLPAE